MIATETKGIAAAIEQAVAALDFEQVSKTYWELNEFLCLDGFLPKEIVEERLVPDVRRLAPHLNRNYIPGHKKGGSASFYGVMEKAPTFLELYRSPGFRSLLNRLTSAPVPASHK